MLNINGLTKKYGDTYVFKDLSTSFNDNGVTLIVGLNGSGKTTFLNAINRMIEVEHGNIFIDGISSQSVEYKRAITYIPSDFYLPDYMTGREFCNFTFSVYKKFNHSMFDLLLHLYDFEDSIDHLIESYSFGMKKKLQIIASFSLCVKYIFADELISGLDLETQLLTNTLIDFLKNERKIILVTHSLDAMNRYTEDIRILDAGKLKIVSSRNEIEEYILKTGVVDDKITSIQKYFQDC
ncbi:ATP-binding cassette domain-containing protein [Enterococcus gallinarum]|uniref:ATP-binding cassette domain-containing protein n=1 Tax=Enterococcus gallinarum TaxID=1353 RepID=UPI00214B2074|nr:ATP-binding cassette domain-containing protein [Enterococcus gallinarum]MCR1926397.1 ATP-binding cassette domain-containing protein [Enterococcus gallinarum]